MIDYFRSRNPKLKVVGITATPSRSDGTALGTVFESVAFQVSINDAIEQGYLVPVKQQFVVVDSLTFEGIKTKRNEFGESDFNNSQLEEVLLKEEMLHKLAKPTLEKTGDKTALVFASSVRHPAT